MCALASSSTLNSSSRADSCFLPSSPMRYPGRRLQSPLALTPRYVFSASSCFLLLSSLSLSPLPLVCAAAAIPRDTLCLNGEQSIAHQRCPGTAVSDAACPTCAGIGCSVIRTTAARHFTRTRSVSAASSCSDRACAHDFWALLDVESACRVCL